MEPYEEYSATRFKIVYGVKHDAPLQDKQFANKDIRLDIRGSIITIRSLWFTSILEAMSAMNGAETTLEVTRSGTDTRRLSLRLGYVDSGLVIRHVIFSPEPEDFKQVAEEHRLYEYARERNSNMKSVTTLSVSRPVAETPNINQNVAGAVELILSELNGGNQKQIAAAIYTALRYEHRTLQESFWSVMLLAQIKYADMEHDDRNEQAVRLAQLVKELAVKNNFDMGLRNL